MSFHKAATKYPRPGAKKGEFTWRLVIPRPRGPDGKYRPKVRHFHGTYKQAKEEEIELRHEHNLGESLERSKLTTGAYLDEWLEISVKPRRAGNTYDLYASSVKNHLKPALGDVPLQKLNALHIERYFAEKEKELSPASLMIHQAILSSALKAAVRKRLIRTNPAADISNKPRIQHQADKLEQVWSADETKQFMRTVKADVHETGHRAVRDRARHRRPPQ
jgi:integrase